MKDATTHLEFCMELCEIQAEQGMYFLFEHPWTATSWKNERVKKVMDAPGVQRVKGHMCQFDMLQDLSVLRLNQIIADDGPIDLDSGSYRTCAQTGEGNLPTQYVLDSEQKPQLITFGLIAWALTDVA